MTRLRAILDRLGDIETTISKTERALASAPSETLSFALESLEVRREMLKEELSEISVDELVDICKYRFIHEKSESYALSAVTTALQNFQEMVSFMYNSITRKAPQSIRLSREIIEKTQFDFGFSYSGSLGIVLTMPNERLLLVDSDIERSIAAVFRMMRAETADDIKAAAVEYGIPVVRKLYKWSKTHKDYGVAANINWLSEGKPKYDISVQQSDLARICSLIEEKSDRRNESIILSGTISAWSVPRRTFTLEFPDGEPISGQWAKEFDGSLARQVPSYYKAHLNKETIVRYASEEDEVKWVLERLELGNTPRA